MGDSDKYKQDVLLHEMDTLRQELQHLKNCQVRYFLFSITMAGGILGVLSGLAAPPACCDPPSVIHTSDTAGVMELGYWAPLLIILPCWVIFFDKATTITRIVGYYRILEREVSSINKRKHYGWENALRDFRNPPKNGELSSKQAIWYLKIWECLCRLIRLLFLCTVHKYWVICWYTFLVLSVVCFCLGWDTDNIKTSIMFTSLTSIVGLGTFYIMWQLVFGRFSYDFNESLWKGILGSLEPGDRAEDIIPSEKSDSTS